MLPRGCLVVSCQAHDDNPLVGPVHMAAMARAAVMGGARGIRADGPADIAAIRAATDVPLIGLLKKVDPRFEVIITANFEAARQVAAAGADIVALDAAGRSRNGELPQRLIARIHDELHVKVMADVATLEEGLAAAAWGADFVATTLSGYTADTAHIHAADLDLLTALVGACEIPVVAEGRFDTPVLVARALELGAHAVVVGTAITNPLELTRRFAAAARAAL